MVHPSLDVAAPCRPGGSFSPRTQPAYLTQNYGWCLAFGYRHAIGFDSKVGWAVFEPVATSLPALAILCDPRAPVPISRYVCALCARRRRSTVQAGARA